jgi:hypothetical protein
MKTSPAIEENKKTIGGYDGFDVREAVRTLKKAEEIKSDPKYLKVVLGEMDNEAKKTEAAAELIKKTSAKLKTTFTKKGT